MFRTRISIVLACILVIGVLIIINMDERTVKIRPSFQTSSMKDLYLTQKKNGAIEWELAATTALMPVKDKLIHLNDLSLKINRTPSIFLTSGSGIYKTDTKDITLNRPVVLTMNDAQFTTNSIHWNNAREVINSDDDVQIKGDKFLIVGSGLAANVKDQRVQIKNNVKATFYR